MKKMIVIISCIVISCFMLIGCDTTSLDKVKDPIKKTYNVIDKIIPILSDLSIGSNVPDEIKNNINIAITGLKAIETTLMYAASILNIDLTPEVVQKVSSNSSSVADKHIQDLNKVINDLDNFNKKLIN